MNYYFGIKNKTLNSQLTIPRFQNRGKTQNDFLVYRAKIQNNKWQIEIVNCEQNKNFYFISSNFSNNDNIFFIAKDNDIKKLDNILITAIDKSYYKYLDDLKQLNNDRIQSYF